MHPAFVRPVRRLFGEAPIPEATAQFITVAGDMLADLERDRAVTTHMMEELARELEERLERVRASEDRYRVLFDAGPHPTFVVRRDNRAVLDWNAAAERTLGWSRADVLDRAVDGLGLCEIGCQFAARLMTLGPISANDVVETTLHARSGEAVEVEVQGLDMLLGDLPAVLVMLRDVTAQRTAERAQRESATRFRAFFDHAASRFSCSRSMARSWRPTMPVATCSAIGRRNCSAHRSTRCCATTVRPPCRRRVPSS